MPESDLAVTAPPVPGLARMGGAVRRVNPIEDPGWDARVRAWPETSFFHEAAWARVLHGAYGFRPCYFTDDDARSLLPIMEVDSWLTGRRGVALPFTDESAPVCGDGASWDRLWREALDYARARGWRYLECRGGRSLIRGVPASTSYYGHRLALAGNGQTRFAHVDGSVRRAVRKAEQSGLRVEFSRSPDAIRVFRRLHCRTRRRHGIPPQPFSFFQNIQRHILEQDQGWVVLAWHDRIPVAGAVFFCSRKTASYKFAASDEAWQHLRPSNLVVWEAIDRFAQLGLAELDFGRTSLDNEGLRRFKLGWGAQERRIDYVRYDLHSRRFVTVRDRASGWYNRVFRRLPLVLSRLAGVAFYRHMA